MRLWREARVQSMRARASFAAACAVAVLSAQPARAGESPVLHVSGMTFVASRGDVNEVVLVSKSARLRTESDVALLEDVHATVAASASRQGFEMTCQKGRLDLASNDFYAEGDVHGRTDEGRVFSAPWVRYEHAQGLLYTDAPVLITESTGTYRGVGFQYFVREKRFRLLGGATLVQEQP